jgi:hypothetical protein
MEFVNAGNEGTASFSGKNRKNSMDGQQNPTFVLHKQPLVDFLSISPNLV